MRIILFLMCFLVLSLIQAQNSILVFHKTEGFHHGSIEAGCAFFKQLGKEHNFEVVISEDASIFNKKDLKAFKLIVFLNTTGNILNQNQEKVFEKLIANGGNFLGIHSAADTEYDWEWYGQLVGAYFVSHPEVCEAEIQLKKPKHPVVSHLPEVWKRTDEWYNYKFVNDDIQVLLNLDETTYEGGENGKVHPIALFHELGNDNIAIYTGGGHTKEAYQEPLFKEHILQCILWAFSENK